MGFPLPAFFIGSFYRNWPAAGLRGSLLICRDWVLPIGRPISITAGGGLATWYLKAIDAAGVRKLPLSGARHRGGLSVLTSFGAFPIELNRSRFSIHSSM